MPSLVLSFTEIVSHILENVYNMSSPGTCYDDIIKLFIKISLLIMPDLGHILLSSGHERDVFRKCMQEWTHLSC